jgi:hypothetical protein
LLVISVGFLPQTTHIQEENSPVVQDQTIAGLLFADGVILGSFTISGKTDSPNSKLL